MQVVFGWDLDGGAFPEDGTSGMGAGGTVVGPRGLVDILERWLGLGRPMVPDSRRIAQMHHRMHRALEAGARPFYAASFETDGWSTAAEILRWRDELVLGGWNCGPVENGGPRLEEFRQLEEIDLPLDAGFADRFAELSAALGKESTRPPITYLRLATPRHLLPPSWSRLLDRLGELGTDITEMAADGGSRDDSDLGKVRQQLLHGTRQPFEGDGSLTLLEADGAVQAAELTAEWLAALPEDRRHDLVIIRGEGSVLLDVALQRMGLPVIGGYRSSPLRGALQLLSLVFELVWSPPNPERLLEFLLVPGGPVPRRVAWLLARALREEPGIAGPKWEKAWQTAKERWRERLEKERGLSGDELERRLEEDERGWRRWIEEFGSEDPKEGLSAPKASRIASELRELFCRRIAASERNGSENELLRECVNATDAFLGALDALHLERIPRIQLARMMDSVLAEGAVLPQAEGEAAEWSLVDRPGQIWDSVGLVVWWDFRFPNLPLPSARWSRSEREALRAAGIAVSDAALGIARGAHGWSAPVRYAREGLLLVRARIEAGEETSIHPVWDRIAAGRNDTDLARIRCDTRGAVREARFRLLGQQIERDRTNPLVEPKMLTTWNVPAGSVGRRREESASGIEKLFGCPLAWVLEYAAALYPGDLANFPSLQQIIGNLAHAIVGELFRHCEDGFPGRVDAEQRARALFDQLVPKMAATLLLPENRERCHEAKEAIAATAGMLAECLAGNKVQNLEFEIERRSEFQGGILRGRLDFVCTIGSGERIVVDMKWTDNPKYIISELDENRSVQLATYWHLERSNHQHVKVHAGFLLLCQGQFVFPNHSPLDADGFRSNVANPNEIWDQICSHYGEEIRKLGSGHAEVSGDKMSGDPKRPLGIRAVCSFCDYGHLCGVGWYGDQH